MIKDNGTINKTGPDQIPGDFRADQPAQTEIAPRSAKTWQQQLAQAIRDPAVLLRRLDLTELINPQRVEAARDFPLLVPEAYLQRMRPRDPDDPLLRQVLPDGAELEASPLFSQDAVGDQNSLLAPGLLQKYSGRALLVTLGQCAVHCRYCFRRHFPYADQPRHAQEWQATLQTLQQQDDVEEIILSGGDPLVLGDNRLAELLADLAQIPHLKRVRVHTRLPIVLPARVTPELLNLFTGSKLQPIFVVHANHPAELAGECAESLRQLVRSGIPTLNQAVLLRGVNDAVETQVDLCTRLINLGVLPYYLHQLDRVQGAAHFETPPATGLTILRALKERLPGYAVPRFVQEIPGQPSKVEVHEL